MKILVPTDFSDNASQALKFAFDFSYKIEVEIMLFHGFQLQPVNHNMGNFILPDNIEDFRKNALKKLESLTAKFSRKGVKFTHVVEYCFFSDLVEEIVEKENIDLIIMGTQGASGLSEIILGSNTSKVMNTVDIPVIAVPNNADFSSIDKIVFATEFKDCDIEYLIRLRILFSESQSEINVVHVTLSNDDEDFKNSRKDLIKFFEAEVKNLDKSERYSFHLVEAETVEEGINNFIEENNIKLIALTSYKKGFFERLFTNNLTRKMAFHSKIPVLSFPAKIIN